MIELEIIIRNKTNMIQKNKYFVFLSYAKSRFKFGCMWCFYVFVCMCSYMLDIKASGSYRERKKISERKSLEYILTLYNVT